MEVLILIFFITILILILIHRKNCIKAHVINLKKNTDRYERFMNSYKLKIPLERFDAIVGKDLDPEKYISKNAYDMLLQSEKNGYRKRHSELTRGAIGCYLSHVELYKKLLNDTCDYYIIFEDDSELLKNTDKVIHEAIINAPDDWDMINFSRDYGYTYTQIINKYIRYNHFYGLTCYIINKKGAKKFLNEFESKPITMQIDSKMSFMIQNKQFVVYGYKDNILKSHRDYGTDIQIPIQEDEKSFLLEDL